MILTFIEMNARPEKRKELLQTIQSKCSAAISSGPEQADGFSEKSPNTRVVQDGGQPLRAFGMEKRQRVPVTFEHVVEIELAL